MHHLMLAVTLDVVRFLLELQVTTATWVLLKIKRNSSGFRSLLDSC